MVRKKKKPIDKLKGLENRAICGLFGVTPMDGYTTSFITDESIVD